ncbi:molybdate ABC transporter substrate-binding protein [Piscinibacter sakaiensis]|uniref:molybdate ABC transporter substrate-binding protein n=1 Tax=Piscinibacter sakaiensis TaxID=1547922 RepID=UPI003AAE2018
MPPSTRSRPLARCTTAWLLVLLCGAWPAQAAELVVSAASSLGNVLREIAPGFESRHPGTRLLFNIASSDTLLAQVSKGAPVDVLAVADAQVMDRADKLGLVLPGSRRDFVGNTMVLITPRDSRIELKSLRDLASPAIRHVALGRPDGVPAGRYARAALGEAGLWPALEAKAVYAQNVRQGLDYVARAEAQAGFVYGSDAASMPDKVKVALVVPTPTPISYPIAVIAGSSRPALAQQFIEHLASPPVQAVFARHGFVSR